ncbi:hypothetical protein G5V65_21425 [Rhodobacter sp. HX-7-19]|uniref:Uncharacterized protein n=1 Tax=Paragemmobacter kunshanensis TaxID=2583234 RepID=A0A6M1TSY2_9RHOB|nr:hypothetical protein [Rhodobacter kunshanensis]NGQ93439.1 hypothetical protein [Rhodobacter kunshanensis]
MGIQFEIHSVSGDVETAAINFLLRIVLGVEIDPVADWPIIRWIILMTPDYRLEEQAENPLRLDAERVALAIDAHREGIQPGIRTCVHGWVEK